MTVKEAAERLEISLSLVYRLIEQRKLACVRIAGRGKRGCIRIRDADLEEFLRRCHDEAVG
ncbi:helix-turn-helix domain-containing protein [Tundrisphaera sp. TA3]|uniref:helix-turn-helix domain-containing protein n=1 Tax=Tundrisphaera sp. TA3 TaxID=3435775 RepID=UPI003EBA13E2